MGYCYGSEKSVLVEVCEYWLNFGYFYMYWFPYLQFHFIKNWILGMGKC